MTKKLINKNLKQLVRSYKNGSKGCVLEGSSRSGKTYAAVDFIVWLCSTQEHNCTIFLVKETYQSFKTTLYEDFKNRLPQYGIPHPFDDAKDVHSFDLFGSTIYFIGADKPSKVHGASCDYMFLNEVMHIPQAFFDQLEMRCRKFWWMDYNPSELEHWVYSSVIPRDDVDYLHTTFNDNPFVPKRQREKILSYEPTQDNVRQGTADEYMWKVYGLGLRVKADGFEIYNPEAFSKMFTMPANEEGNRYITADIALHGSDLFVIGIWYGYCLREVHTYQKSDGAEIINSIRTMMVYHNIPAVNVAYDADGVGGFVGGFIEGSKAIHNGAKAENDENYKNLKTQLYYKSGAEVSRGTYTIHPDVTSKTIKRGGKITTIGQEMKRERAAILRDKPLGDGKLCILPKDKMHEIIGCSPDFLDMFAYRGIFDLSPAFELVFI